MIEFIHKGAYFGCSCIHGWLFLKQHLQLFQVLFNRLGILGQHSGLTCRAAGRA
jgi:hypothetical protein